MAMDRGNDARGTRSPSRCRPAVEPAAAAAFESNTPPRRPVRLERLDKKMEERRETARKKVAESHIELRDQLNKAGDRRRDILAKRSQTLANKAVRKAERKAAKKASSTAFVVTPVSDTNVIAPRESRRRRTMEARMEKRRARVAKTSTADALETRQAEAAERRQANVRATKDKARRFGRAASPVWIGLDKDQGKTQLQDKSIAHCDGQSGSIYWGRILK
ncbi:Hypp1984 [Branchiostoma lanceolatum]|uniref:Hypp1984 protein n=1 Tax=Branchiostoma lanceolatum TaxID=7740 RepID=A0A8J9ZQ29_BRALA|nr:Hypp1984 [Branchiostoma lanceolatum]